jgi:hypothetical protein
MIWGEPRRDLADQLLNSDLIWYWQYEGPLFQRLTAATVPILRANLLDWMENPGSWYAMTTLCAIDPSMNIAPAQADVDAFLAGTVTSLRLVVIQVGDKQVEMVYVRREDLTLPTIRPLLTKWGIEVP